MSGTARIFVSIVVIALVALGIAAWVIRGPGPMAFSDGPKVALSDYRDGKPTGVLAAQLQDEQFATQAPKLPRA